MIDEAVASGLCLVARERATRLVCSSFPPTAQHDLWALPNTEIALLRRKESVPQSCVSGTSHGKDGGKATASEETAEPTETAKAEALANCLPEYSAKPSIAALPTLISDTTLGMVS